MTSNPIWSTANRRKGKTKGGTPKTRRKKKEERKKEKDTLRAPRTIGFWYEILTSWLRC